MKILVTGCAGFIGFHLTRRLLAEGHAVTGVDNLNDYYAPTLKIARLQQLGIRAGGTADGDAIAAPGRNLTFIRAGIENRELYSEHLNAERFDLVCHLAAQAGVRYSIDQPQTYVTSNIQGFFNILEYVRHHPVKRLVFASSSSVYGKNAKIPYSETDRTDNPVSLYAATKKSNELFARCYTELYGMEAIGLRFFTVYGPWGRPDMAPFLFTRAILKGEPINVFNGGHMHRDFTYVDDIVEGVCKVLLEEPRITDPEPFRIYNIGCSHPVDLNDFIGTIERISGRPARKNYLPMQPGDVKATWANTSLLQAHYAITNDNNTLLENGLKKFIEWYEQYDAEKLSANL